MNKTIVTPAEAVKKTERVFAFALLGIGLIVFFTQLRSLLYFPAFDSYLWWGDESWLMLEFKSQITHGIFRHPFALGATIHSSNGLLLSNMWISALLYGLPQALISSGAPVAIGRIVTGFLSIALLASTYSILRKQQVSPMLASLAMLLLITSRTFLLTSHSARYDVLTALALLWIVYFFATPSITRLTPLHLLILGAALPLTLLISHHLLLLSGGLFLYAFIRMGAHRNLRTSLTLLAGAALAASLMICVYWLTTGNIQLLSSAGGKGFLLNVREMPILRPFSRSVQVANLVQRWQSATLLAPLVLAFVVIVFTTWLTARLRRGGSLGARGITPFTICTLIVSVAWLFFESSAPTSYLVYVTPIALVASAIAMQHILDRLNAPIGLSATALFLTFIVGVAISVMGYRDSTDAAKVGLAITAANSTACDQMHSAIMTDALKHHRTNPLVLLFNPAVHCFVGYSDLRPMTTHFIEYPADAISPDSAIRRLSVEYVLIYASAIKPDYMREVQPISEIIHSRGELLTKTSGLLTDIGRSYFLPDAHPPQDTLSLYRLSQ